MQLTHNLAIWPYHTIPTHLYALGSSECEQSGIDFDSNQTVFYYDRKFKCYEMILNAPARIPEIRPKQVIISIACGGMHTLVLLVTGQIFAWGCNDNMCLGYEGAGISPRIVEISGSGLQITAGDSHSMAIVWNRQQRKRLAFFWGAFRSMDGEMGEVVFPPKEICASLEDQEPIKIASGYNHAMVLGSLGNVFAWGDPTGGKIGRKPANRRIMEKSLMIIKLGISKADDIWACGNHSFCTAMRKKRGDYILRLHAWGLNKNGQLGLGHLNDVVVPEILDAFNGEEIDNICGGEFFSMFLLKSGELYGTGLNQSGQLGVPEIGPIAMRPVKVAVDNVFKISAGPQFCYAIQKSGDVFVWGDGSNFVLGNRNEDIIYSPEKLEVLQDLQIVKVGAGGQHVIMIAADRGQLQEKRRRLEDFDRRDAKRKAQ